MTTPGISGYLVTTSAPESRNLRGYRKALAKHNALKGKRAAVAAKLAPRIEALEARLERVRRPLVSMDSKVRDAETQAKIRWMKLTGGEQGKVALQKGTK